MMLIFDFKLRRSCKISGTQVRNANFSRGVTAKQVVLRLHRVKKDRLLSITEIWQLRRRKK